MFTLLRALQQRIFRIDTITLTMAVRLAQLFAALASLTFYVFSMLHLH